MTTLAPGAAVTYIQGVPAEDHVPQWLTVDEVAQIVRVHPETVRLWLRQGRLKGRNLGRGAGWRVSRVELDRFMQRDRD